MPECPQCRSWVQAAELSAFDVAYWSQTKEAGGPQLFLQMGDTFAWACADGEPVPFELVPEVYEIWKTAGWQGLVRWVAKRRGVEPLPGILDPPIEK